jgi:alpha-tubulin suppressor-like RCC1 family protein
VILASIAHVVSVAAGAVHSCVIRIGGTVACWGSNGHGQLGDNSTIDRYSPVSNPGLSDVVSVAGDLHSCALTSFGTVKCWGMNTDGQLGDGTTQNRYVPQIVPGLSGVVMVAARYYDTCA